MAQGIQTRGGAIMLWRVGNLEFGEQSRWTRSPKPRGLWAFPWPYADSFFYYHQYSDRLPKRLQYHPHSHFPRSREWYFVAREGSGPYAAEEDRIRELTPKDRLLWPEADEFGRVDCPSGVGPDGEPLYLGVRDGLYDAQLKWIDTVGKRILPLRKFWYEGDLYSHFDHEGRIGNPGTFMGETDWYLIHSSTLARNIVRSRGNRHIERDSAGGLQHWRTSLDHMEVFIAPGQGRISSPRDLR